MGLAAFNRMRRMQKREESDEQAAQEVDINKLKVDELKALLDERGVDYPSDAKKADLQELAQ